MGRCYLQKQEIKTLENILFRIPDWKRSRRNLMNWLKYQYHENNMNKKLQVFQKETQNTDPYEFKRTD